MANHVTAEIALTSAIAAAAQQYATLVTDHDPDDGDHVVPGELRRFLARLRLLHGVPFSYLVPDATLLPIESIRFFYVDRAWTDAVVQGVLSVGTITTTDRAQLESVYPFIRDEVDETERTIRMPGGETRLSGAGGVITGFLLRSRAVSGWPNLHVRAYARDVVADDALTTVAESNPERLKVLRMERLAPAVLLVLFDGVPEVVHIEEPRQGIQFGVRYDENEEPSQYSARVKVRDCDTGDPVPPEDEITDANSVAVPFRPGAPGVIDLATLRTRLAAKAPNSGGTLEPNEFALQMLRFPYRQVFGDPDNQDEAGDRQFYDLGKFKVTIGLTAWKGEIEQALARVNP
jgi:hypothetical protein